MTDMLRPADPTVRDLPLAPGGEVELRLTSSRLRIRAVDGDRVVIRSRSGRELDRELEIQAGPDFVRVIDGPPGALRIGPLTVRAGGHAPDLDVDVPRTARIAARTLSGDVDAVGIGGPSRWSSASGDLVLSLEGGPVAVETVSGDAAVTASVPVGVTARTVSGDVRIRAPRLLTLDAATTSGDIVVEAALAEGGHHAIASVSGDVRLTTGSEVRIDAQSISGDLRASMPHRSEGGRGRRTVIVGSGRVQVTVRTMSGDVNLRPGAPDQAIPMPAPAPAAPPAAPTAPATPSAPPAVVAAATAAAPSGSDDPAAPMPGATATADPVGSAPADEPMPAEALDDTSVVAPPARDDVEAARLAILRALESGELDVDAASERLAMLEDAAIAAGD